MRKLLLLVMGMLISNVLLAQNVYNGNLTLTSQAEVNAFNYSEIQGNLTIRETIPGNIIDLSTLTSLEKLEGGLFVKSNKNIQNLNGFSNLTAVNGTLQIEGNANLENLSGLSGIERVTRDLLIHNNHKIKTLTAFNNLVVLGGKLSVHWNTGLTSMDGFTSLTRLGGDITITANLNMTNLNGLSNVIYIGGHLRLINNRLYNLRPLRKVAVVGKSLIIKKSNIYNLNDLSGIEEIHGGLYIHNNKNLQDIEGISAALKGNFVTLDFVNNPNLQSIEGVEKITSINVDVRFVNHPRLTNLDPLSNIMRIIDNLDIRNNSNLESACGIIQLLEDPNAVGRNITISNNAIASSSAQAIIDACNECRVLNGDIILTTQSDIESFKYCKINGSLTIEESAPGAIQNLSNLYKLITVVGNISIKNNTALDDITALSNLKALRGGLILDGNQSLTNTGNFNKLSSLGGRLTIANNPLLTDLSGLATINIIRGNLTVSNNQNLADLDGLDVIGLDLFRYCDIRIQDNASLKNIDVFSGISMVPGSIIITNNPVLENLDGLSDVRGIQDDMIIAGNTGLQNACGILKMVERQRIDTLIWGVRSIELANNGPNSSSREDIINTCNIVAEGDITLTSQEEVDAFDYQIVKGSLIIEETVSGNITNLLALQSLKEAGSIIIKNNTALKNLRGLTYNLRTVTQQRGGFVLDNNPELYRISTLRYDYYDIYTLLCFGVINQAQVRWEPSARFEIIEGYPVASFRCPIPSPQNPFRKRETDDFASSKSSAASAQKELVQGPILYPTISNGNSVNLSGLETDFLYSVYNVTGMLVQQGNIKNNQAQKTIQFDRLLSTGVYLLKIQEKEAVTTLRFIVK
ncbi:T9SS type A sorting domain-containing protein [Aquimarina sp. 2201CG14-23]|uniref:T9SS type A sorting domain-containing protein n=1 Tax=Aquimarina mycalae TaxID=3040073 RepID=UPI0024781BA0|nr:T9SS type A sorting domain-containing protein [Aquimarina sp. 2201CG14-23]MDH7447669.1 T9SS type A sorting domain-containing protein [Aquimarina sp. 2201CG14-23]